MNERTLKIVAAHCAIQQDTQYFAQLIQNWDASALPMLETDLRRMQATKLLRTLSRSRANKDGVDADFSLALTQQDDSVYLNGRPIGKTLFLYKTVIPHEAQSRIAYEIFYETFFDLLAQQWKILSLSQNEFAVEIFIPAGQEFQLESAWEDACRQIFGLQNLRRTFVALVNSIKLTNRGFSALDLPMVSLDQSTVLAAFNLSNLVSLQRGDAKLHSKIQELDLKIETTKDASKHIQLQKQRDDTLHKLQVRTQRYTPAYQLWDEIKAEFPEWSKEVETAQQALFTSLAGNQLSKRQNIVDKTVRQILELAMQPKLIPLRPFIQKVAATPAHRKAGDSNSRICYSCGDPLAKGEPVFKANSFIFSSPSQRLQSGGGQKEPPICSNCAFLAFVSPIKLGEGRLVVRLHLRGHESSLMLDEQLRMLALGEMNVVAGRYALLQANERIGTDPIIDKLGGAQYAIYKVGTLFPPEVFDAYAAEVTLGESRLQLHGRHMAWMNRLAEVFDLRRSKWDDKGEFAAFGRAIRHIEKDEVIFAIYELLKQNLVSLPLNTVRATQLESLRSEQIRWLRMDKEQSKAEFYRDVAGMTGLLYAFCSYVKSQFTGNEQRIEVRKLIERTGDPYQFNYTAAGNTGSEMATLFRSEDMHFSFDETKRLLAWIGVNAVDRESPNERGQSTLKLYLDDVVKAYTQFFEEKYTRTKDQRDFVYALQLSLHARFPELIERKKENE